jgi:hypothetical protein
MLSFDPVFSKENPETKKIMQDLWLLNNPSYLDKQIIAVMQKEYNADPERTDNRASSEPDKNKGP